MTNSGRRDAPAETDGELALLLAATAEMLDNEPDTVWADPAVRAAAKRLRDALSDRIADLTERAPDRTGGPGFTDRCPVDLGRRKTEDGYGNADE